MSRSHLELAEIASRTWLSSRILLFSLAAVIVGASVNAQTTARNNIAEPVVLNVSVWDPNQRFITNFISDQFQVYENGKQQRIIGFSQLSDPVSVGILLDTTLSMGVVENDSSPENVDLLSPMVRGLGSFVAGCSDGYDFFVIRFSNEIKVEVETTSDRDEIADYLDTITSRSASGRTTPYDALKMGLAKLEKAKHARRVLIIATDFIENPNGKINYDEARKLLRSSDVSLYFVKPPIPLYVRNTGQWGTLAAGKERTLINESGGLYVTTDSSASVKEAFDIIARELRSQYQITYQPDPLPKSGKWNKVDVRLKPSGERAGKNSELSIKARSGYVRY